MHIGMRLLHPAAADHSVNISRQQVQRIFRFSLRSRAGDPAAQRWYSSRGDGMWCLRSLLQGTRVTYVTETFPISRSLRVTSGNRRIGIPTKRPRILPLPVSCGSLLRPYFLITLGNVPVPLGTGTLRKPILPKGGSEALTHMNNRLGAYGRLEVIVASWQNVCRGNTGSEAIPWTLHIWDPIRSLHMDPSPLPVLTDSSSEGLAPDAPPHLAAEGTEELDRVYSTDSLEQF